MVPTDCTHRNPDQSSWGTPQKVSISYWLLSIILLQLQDQIPVHQITHIHPYNPNWIPNLRPILTLKQSFVVALTFKNVPTLLWVFCYSIFRKFVRSLSLSLSLPRQHYIPVQLLVRVIEVRAGPISLGAPTRKDSKTNTLGSDYCGYRSTRTAVLSQILFRFLPSKPLKKNKSVVSSMAPDSCVLSE